MRQQHVRPSLAQQADPFEAGHPRQLDVHEREIGRPAALGTTEAHQGDETDRT
jgi:hypothetical protein